MVKGLICRDSVGKGERSADRAGKRYQVFSIWAEDNTVITQLTGL